MSRGIAAGRGQESFDAATASTARGSTEAVHWPFRVIPGRWSLAGPLPLRWRLWGLTVLGLSAAVGVGLLTSENPDAGPPGFAVVTRVAIISALVVVGAYTQASNAQSRMGAVLIAAGLFSAVWLLNGSSDRIAFSLGVLCAGLAPTIFAYLMLAHPTGRLHSRTEHQLLLIAGGGAALLWGLILLTTAQPPLHTALIRCSAHCPANTFFLGFPLTSAVPVLRACMVICLIVLTCGTPVLVHRRSRSASAPLRAALTPISVVAVASAVLLIAHFAAQAVGSSAAIGFGAAYVGTAIAIPVAVLLGLSAERLFMGRTLAEFVNQLAKAPRSDPQTLMAVALRDPTLRIAYERPTTGNYVDSSGLPVAAPEADPTRAVAFIEQGHRRVAAVTYDPGLSGEQEFVQAAGAAALMRLESSQLEAELRASTANLAASRVRLIETAHAERRRIERDLHDGVQQDLVGLRIKLELAAELIAEEPARGERIIASVGHQLDDVLEALRSLARGIYPSLLHERGVAEALKSAARRSPLAVSVHQRGLGRYPEEVEVAVYFCCLEALQNVVKHAGTGAEATIRLWEDESRLCFEVSDSGAGFDADQVGHGHGLVNMSDRVEAVGGTLIVSAGQGHGTSVRGAVPIAPAGHDSAPATT